MQQNMDAYSHAQGCNTDCIGNPGGFVPPWTGFPHFFDQLPTQTPCAWWQYQRFQDKTRRFSGGQQQEIESMLHQANIDASFLDNNGSDFMNSCEIAQAIADNGATIGQQAGEFICPTTVTTTPCAAPTPTLVNITGAAMQFSFL